jgi:hypothetical protein
MRLALAACTQPGHTPSAGPAALPRPQAGLRLQRLCPAAPQSALVPPATWKLQEDEALRSAVLQEVQLAETACRVAQIERLLDDPTAAATGRQPTMQASAGALQGRRRCEAPAALGLEAPHCTVLAGPDKGRGRGVGGGWCGRGRWCCAPATAPLGAGGEGGARSDQGAAAAHLAAPAPRLASPRLLQDLLAAVQEAGQLELSSARACELARALSYEQVGGGAAAAMRPAGRQQGPPPAASHAAVAQQALRLRPGSCSARRARRGPKASLR